MPFTSLLFSEEAFPDLAGFPCAYKGQPVNTEIIILAVAFSAPPRSLVLVFGWRSVRQEGKRVLEAAQREAAQVVEDAKRQSETQMREAEVAAREKLLQARSEFEKVSRKRRAELEAAGAPPHPEGRQPRQAGRGSRPPRQGAVAARPLDRRPARRPSRSARGSSSA